MEGNLGLMVGEGETEGHSLLGFTEFQTGPKDG